MNQENVTRFFTGVKWEDVVVWQKTQGLWMRDSYPVGWWNGSHYFNGSSWILGESNSTHFWYNGRFVMFTEYYISYRFWRFPYFNGNY